MSSKYPLIWNGPFKFPGLCVLHVLGDGSCLIHAVLLAYNQDYRIERQGSRFVSRQDQAVQFRHQLAHYLSMPSDPLQPGSPSQYLLLGRGNLPQVSIKFPQYTLDNMKKTLTTQESLDYMYFEPISDYINKDIYVLDNQKQDVYITGEEDLYQKGRESIIILFTGNHYDLVGLSDDRGVIQTLFAPDHPLIEAIKRRQRSKR